MSGMIKRLAALTAVVFILAATPAVMTAYADETDATEAEPSGYWKRYDITEEKKIDNSNNQILTSSGSRCHYSCSAKYTGDRTAYHTDEDLAKDIGSPCKGESMSASLDIEEPPEIITPGKEVALHVSGSLSHSDPHDAVLFCPQAHVDYGKGNGDNTFGSFMDSKGQKNLGFDRTWQIDPYYHAIGKGNYFIEIESDNILRATFNEGTSPDSEIWLSVSIGCGSEGNQLETRYWYEWISTVPTEPIEATVNKAAGSTEGEDDGSVIDNDIVNGKPEPEKKPKGSERRKSAAAAATGGVAVGGAAAFLAAYNKKKKKNNDVGYRMIVDKDFGDTIYPGQTYKVYARIEQFDRKTNVVSSADEHTRKITAFSKDFNVKSSFESRRGRLACCAEFTFDHLLSGRTATISFKITGKGGTFTENVIFNIDLSHRISAFYELSETRIPLKTFDITAMPHDQEPRLTHGLFLGEQTNNTLYFAVQGFYKPPRVSVRFDAHELSAAVLQIDSINGKRICASEKAFFYQVDIKNSSDRPTYKGGDKAVFARSIDAVMTITAEGDRDAKTEGRVRIPVIPKGFYYDLSFADLKQKSESYIELYTDELDETGQKLRTTVLPLRYGYVQMARPYHYQRIVSTRTYFDKEQKDCFVPINKKAEKVKNQFNLYVTGGNTTDMYFLPKLPVMLEKPDDELMFRLCVCAKEVYPYEFGSEEHKGYFDARIFGVYDDQGFYDRVVELNRLAKLIKLYALDDNEKIKSMRARYQTLPTRSINCLSRWLIEYGGTVQESILMDALKDDIWKSFYIDRLENLKWLCDVAFSVVLRIIAAKCGQEPELIEAVVTPVKGYIEEYASEISAYEPGKGQNPALFDVKRIAKTFEESVEDCLFGKAGNLKGKKMAYMLVAAAALNLAKHSYIEIKNYDEAVAKGKPPAEHYTYCIFREFAKDISIRTLKLWITKKLFSSNANDLMKKIFAPGTGMEAKLKTATNGTMMSQLQKSYSALFDEIFKETVIEKGLPDRCKPLIDMTIDGEMLEAKWSVVFISFSSNDIALKSGEYIERVTVDAARNVVRVISESGYFELPSSAAICMFIDSSLERLGFYKLFDGTGEPFKLPASCPYVGGKETIESLDHFGLYKEANYLRNEMTKNLTGESFSSTAQPGRFNARTDFHRYEY